MKEQKDKTTGRALLSVHNKAGIDAFARGLVGRGFEIVSSGGTARHLAQESIPVTKVSEITRFPEILAGRVKTLHPAIHGGILARRGIDSDLEELENHQIVPVDVVAVNFYPFEAKVAEKGTVEEIIENIDVGGPSMLRAAVTPCPRSRSMLISRRRWMCISASPGRRYRPSPSRTRAPSGTTSADLGAIASIVPPLIKTDRSRITLSLVNGTR